MSENKKENKNKKKIIIIIAVCLCVAAAGIAAAVIVSHRGGEVPAETSNPEYVAVTDENGEPVTDENGDVVTAPASSDAATSDANGTSAAPAQNTTSASGNAGSDSATTKQTIKKPNAPKVVTGLKVVKAEEDSIEIKWDKVDCNGYQIAYQKKGDTGWVYYPEDVKTDELYGKTSIKFTKLEPYTTYYFRVSAVNRNQAGVSQTDWRESVSVSATTKELKEKRKISFAVQLPVNSGRKDTINIYVNDELVYTGEVELKGGEIPIPETQKAYEGIVKVKAELVNENVFEEKQFGGRTASFDLSQNGIDTQYDEDEEL